jgi:hypothetical protein
MLLPAAAAAACVGICDTPPRRTLLFSFSAFFAALAAAFCAFSSALETNSWSTPSAPSTMVLLCALVLWPQSVGSG